MKLAIFLGILHIMAALAVNFSIDTLFKNNNTIGGPAASYNSLRNQTAYCKFQSFDTVSRDTSSGPASFLNGNVFMFVGLTSKLFGDAHSGPDMPEGAWACGICIQILRVDNMPLLYPNLTNWDSSRRMPTPFTVMVGDQCTDPVCQQDAYLDFDIYSLTQPVYHGNPGNLTWRAIPCPVDGSPIEFLFCTSDTCNVQNTETVNSFLRDRIVTSYLLSFIIRNHRVPVSKVLLRGVGYLQYVSGIGYIVPMSNKGAIPPLLEIEIIPLAWGLNLTQRFEIRDFDKPSTPGYRGGLLLYGDSNL